jgi:hypothetical protein
MESWAGALADRDEELQGKIKAKMPRFITLQNVGPEEFNILAACVAGENIDVVKAVAEVDLVRAIDPEQGPWVMALRPAAVEALARMQVDEPLFGRWVRHVVGFHGGTEDFHRSRLPAKTAESLKELCGLAVTQHLEVFICCYG